MLNIDIINQTTVLTDAQVVAVIPSCQSQISNDVGPIWDVAATYNFVPRGQTPNPAHYQMIVANSSDQANALGYHELTSAGQPIGYTFAGDALKYGQSWSVTLTHELAELAVDPWCMYSVAILDNGGNCTCYMLEVGDACFTGDTKISLLNGTERTIQSLMGEEPFWIYSCDDKGNIVPGKARAARKTGKQKELIQITLDNGEVIKCTTNHRFLMRDGTYKEASKMIEGESLMPLYRQNRKLNKAIPKSKDYEQVYNPATNDWVFTHRMVEPNWPKNCVRHHKDFNRFNNSRDNLALNHKISSIESIKSQDVYDITVEKYHNFALSAGVFVHNCEDDQFAYEINGVKVTDFALPAWWQPGSVGPFDFKRHCSAPLQLLSGGYIGVLSANSTTGWTQKTAEHFSSTSRSAVPHIGSRRARRNIPKSQWKRSEI